MDFDLSVSERTLDVSMGEETLTGTVVLGRLHPENPVRAAAAPIASCCGALSKWHSASTVRRCQIHDLKGVDCTDGGFPAGLILASDGNFYPIATGGLDLQSWHINGRLACTWTHRAN